MPSNTMIPNTALAGSQWGPLLPFSSAEKLLGSNPLNHTGTKLWGNVPYDRQWGTNKTHLPSVWWPLSKTWRPILEQNKSMFPVTAEDNKEFKKGLGLVGAELLNWRESWISKLIIKQYNLRSAVPMLYFSQGNCLPQKSSPAAKHENECSRVSTAFSPSPQRFQGQRKAGQGRLPWQTKWESLECTFSRLSQSV